MKKIINSVKMGVKAALTPWEIAAPDWADTNGEMGKWINMDATFKVSEAVCLLFYQVCLLFYQVCLVLFLYFSFKNDEKSLDLVMETSRGKEERKDIPLRLNWTPMMRKLKFTSTIKRLMDMRIISELL